jgi:hypothetical protein
MAPVAPNHSLQWKYDDNDPEHDVLEQVEHHVPAAGEEVVLVPQVFGHFSPFLMLAFEDLGRQRVVRV